MPLSQSDFTLGVRSHYGSAIAAIGDVDGNGAVDLAVGASKDNEGGENCGAVWITLMNADGSGAAVSHRKLSPTGEGGGNTNLGSLCQDQLDYDDGFGSSIAALGDLDGDGVPDLAVGAPGRNDESNLNRGAIFILFLNNDGSVKAYQEISNSEGDFVLEGNSNLLDGQDEFGNSIANMGDLDSDGVVDLAVGAWKDDHADFNRRGSVWMLFLKSNGKVKMPRKLSTSSEPESETGWSGNPFGGWAYSLDNKDHFGTSVAKIADLDGDGTPELAVGAFGDDDGGNSRGCVYILFLDAGDGVNFPTSHFVKRYGKLASGSVHPLEPSSHLGFLAPPTRAHTPESMHHALPHRVGSIPWTTLLPITITSGRPSYRRATSMAMALRISSWVLTATKIQAAVAVTVAPCGSSSFRDSRHQARSRTRTMLEGCCAATRSSATRKGCALSRPASCTIREPTPRAGARGVSETMESTTSGVRTRDTGRSAAEVLLGRW